MGPRPHLSLRACKTKRLTSELQVSMGPRPHLLFFCFHNGVIMSRINSLYESQPSSVVFACKTTTLGPELQVSTVPDLTYGFLHSKQRL